VKTTLVLGLLALMPALGDVALQTTPDKDPPQREIVVSVQRLSTESIEGRAANQRLLALAQKMSADLVAKQKELAQPAGPEYQRLAQQSQADFASAQRQAQADMRARVNPIIADVAAEHGADVVLNAETIVWASKRLDVTNEVLSKLDAGAPAPGK